MKIVRKSIYILLTCLFAVPIVHADGFKKYAGEFLNNGVGSRALAMGGAHGKVGGVGIGYFEFVLKGVGQTA